VASPAFDLNPGRSWLDDPSNVTFATTVSAAEAEPNVAAFLGGGKTSSAFGVFSGETERAGVWTVEGAASKRGEAAGSGRRGSISTPRFRALGSTVNPSLGRASRKNARPKKATAVAVATTPRERRKSKVPRLVAGILVPSFGRSEGAPGALAGCEPGFRHELRDASCCASSTNDGVASVRRDISRSRFAR
jgi:hypothetical protein